MKTPDITPVQLVALVGAIVDTAVQFGVHLTSGQQHVLLADAAVLAALVLGDAHIRNGRAQGIGMIEAAGTPTEATLVVTKGEPAPAEAGQVDLTAVIVMVLLIVLVLFLVGRI